MHRSDTSLGLLRMSLDEDTTAINWLAGPCQSRMACLQQEKKEDQALLQKRVREGMAGGAVA